MAGGGGRTLPLPPCPDSIYRFSQKFSTKLLSPVLLLHCLLLLLLLPRHQVAALLVGFFLPPVSCVESSLSDLVLLLCRTPQVIELSSYLEKRIASSAADADKAVSEYNEIGKVVTVGDGIARVYGLNNVQAGEVRREVAAVAVSFAVANRMPSAIRKVALFSDEETLLLPSRPTLRPPNTQDMLSPQFLGV